MFWRAWRGGSDSDLLVLLITFFETLWTLKVNRKKLRLGLSYYWVFLFKYKFWVNGELNRFGVVGASDPIEIP